MTAIRLRTRVKLAAAGVLLTLALVGWWQRQTLQAWWYVRCLSTAGEADRAGWVERVAGVGEAAVPFLIDCLRRDENACVSAGMALDHLAADWGPGDDRTAAMAMRLARDFSSFDTPGKRHALAAANGWFRGQPAPAVTEAGTRLLAESLPTMDDAAAAVAAVGLAAVALGHDDADLTAAAREAVRAGLHASAPAVRLRAIQTALHPRLQLIEPVVGLLADPVAEVRRAALLAVAPAEDVVRVETLLPCLHDPDAEVERLCVEALQARGLRRDQIKLGRLLTHPNPLTRLQVLDHLGTTAGMDPSVWLRRLSHDPSPAVRAASLRAMRLRPGIDLGDRIDQMARDDPSDAVCYLARYYLRCPPPPTRPDE